MRSYNGGARHLHVSCHQAPDSSCGSLALDCQVKEIGLSTTTNRFSQSWHIILPQVRIISMSGDPKCYLSNQSRPSATIVSQAKVQLVAREVSYAASAQHSQQPNHPCNLLFFSSRPTLLKVAISQGPEKQKRLQPYRIGRASSSMARQVCSMVESVSATGV